MANVLNVGPHCEASMINVRVKGGDCSQDKGRSIEYALLPVELR